MVVRSHRLNSTILLVCGGNSLGDLYVVDQNNGRIRRLGYNSDNVETVAGSVGVVGYASGDGGPAASATFGLLYGVSGNAYGDLFVTDHNSSEVRLIRGSDSEISLLAGNGSHGFSGDNERASSAMLSSPGGLFVASTNAIYVVDQGNNRIRKMYYSTVPTDLPSESPTEMPVTGAPSFQTTYAPSQFPSDAPTSKLYYIDTLAGTGNQGSTGTDGPATAAELATPQSVWQDSVTGMIYVAEYWGYCIRRVDVFEIIHDFAGICGTYGVTSGSGSATSSPLSNIGSVFGCAGGLVYVTDYANGYLKQVDTTGIMSTYAGTGISQDSGDEGPATSASLNKPNIVWADTVGSVYVSEDQAYVVRKITDGYIVRFAGTLLVIR